MNVIDKLRYFEDMKRCGFIVYNGDGSGYYRSYWAYDIEIYFNSSGLIKSWVSIDLYGDAREDDFYIDKLIWEYLSIMSVDNKYIDGWISEKISKYATRNAV